MQALDTKPKTWFQGYLTSFPDQKRHVYEGDGLRNHLVAIFEREEDAAEAVTSHNAHLRMLPATAHSRALIDVVNERDRQISVEGWSAVHDDKHDKAEMARAAASYVMQYIAARTWFALSSQVRAVIGWLWPWDAEWFKPSSSRRDLVKAAALLLAEIERDDRAASKAGGANA